MSQISKCPNVRVVLTYWEASREVSELSYKSLLYFSSNGSYCSTPVAHISTWRSVPTSPLVGYPPIMPSWIQLYPFCSSLDLPLYPFHPPVIPILFSSYAHSSILIADSYFTFALKFVKRNSLWHVMWHKCSR